MARISVDEARRKLYAANISTITESEKGEETNLVVFVKGGPFYWSIIDGKVDASYLRNVLS